MSKTTGDHVSTWRFHHVGISVGDLDAQVGWYQEVLGLRHVCETGAVPEPAIRYAMLEDAGGLRVELVERRGSTPSELLADPIESTRARGLSHWAIAVEDLDLAFSRIVGAGGAEVWPPTDGLSAGTRIAFIKDPEGNLIELIAPAAGY